MAQAVMRQRIASLIAVVLLLNLSIPVIAGATVKRDQWASLFNIICTSAGLKVLGAEDGTSSSHNPQNGIHCPLCVLGGSAPLPSKAASFDAVFQISFISKIAALETPHAMVYWPSASPRGPPRNA